MAIPAHNYDKLRDSTNSQANKRAKSSNKALYVSFLSMFLDQYSSGLFYLFGIKKNRLKIHREVKHKNSITLI